MKVFLAYSFSSLIDPSTGVVIQDQQRLLENMRQHIINRGHAVFLAHFREKWGKALMTDCECTSDDFEEMKSSDLVVAFPGTPISGGVHIELGWASCLKKPVIILSHQDQFLSPLVTGLHTITQVQYYKYSDTTIWDTFIRALNEYKR